MADTDAAMRRVLEDQRAKERARAESAEVKEVELLGRIKEARDERDRLREALREILRYLDSTGWCGDHHITLGEACGTPACVLCLAESVALAALSADYRTHEPGQNGSLTPAETVVRGVPVTRSKPQDATERCQETDNGANDPPRAQGTGASEGRPGGPGLNRGSDSHTPLADSVPCTCFSYNPDCPTHGTDWDCGDCGKTWPPGVLSCADCLSETDKPRRARLGVPQTEERAGKPEQPDSVPTCPKCNGRGWYGVIAGDRKECRVCGGSGSSKGGE